MDNKKNLEHKFIQESSRPSEMSRTTTSRLVTWEDALRDSGVGTKPEE